MLVLSRRTNEKIVMPTLNTTIQVVSAKMNLVRLGVEAPDSVPVFREEVLSRLGSTERSRLVAASTESVPRLREQNRLLTNALGTALTELGHIRKHLGKARPAELAIALELLVGELKVALQKAESPTPTPAPVNRIRAQVTANDEVVY